MWRLGLIGYPLGHSFSANYFNQKFAGNSVPGIYKLFPIPEPSLIGEFLEANRSLNGFNVTIPYKREIMQWLDEISPDAAEIGAVNTVKVCGGQTEDTRRYKGYNTDWLGFTESISPLLRGREDIRRALVLGTGGAAAAVAYALRRLGIAPLFVSRRPDMAPEQMRPAISYDEITAALIAETRLVVNATPLGTFPDVETCPPLPYHLLTDRHICHDLVYNPAETLFMRRAAEHGATVKNGYEMLVGQAEHAWLIWQQTE